ncbi:MAG: PilN domain-containing protein [Gammaproteobacteria bacterium]|nr:PilN domain-containing protein [Gammaproteobacteria bacterium]
MTSNSFFHWWFSQLAALVPASLRRGWQPLGATVSVEVDGPALKVSATGSDEPITVDPSDTSARSEAMRSRLRAGLPQSLKSIRIRLAPHEFLVRRFTLPHVARTHLTEAVGYQLPKLTPFSASQVIYACGIEDQSSDNSVLNVWLVALPRRRLTTIVKLLGLDMPEPELNLAGPPQPDEALEFIWRVAPRHNLSARKGRLLWIGAVGVWLLALGLHLNHQYRTHAELSTTLSELRKQALEVSHLRDRVQVISTRVDWLTKRKQATVSSLEVLDTVTRELDDDTWLQTLELNQDKLTLQGLSPAPAGLIEKLEQSHLLHDVRFEAAITQDARSSGSRFSISASVQSTDSGDGT